jgi:hypothetical protein
MLIKCNLLSKKLSFYLIDLIVFNLQLTMLHVTKPKFHCPIKPEKLSSFDDASWADTSRCIRTKSAVIVSKRWMKSRYHIQIYELKASLKRPWDRKYQKKNTNSSKAICLDLPKSITVKWIDQLDKENTWLRHLSRKFKFSLLSIF